jgi:hypothetical protein
MMITWRDVGLLLMFAVVVGIMIWYN